MGKRNGKPYDPIIRQSEHGARLYEFWKRIRRSPCCEEWDYYPTFYNWAMQNGYSIGAGLQRTNKDDPYSPDNCYWKFDNECQKRCPEKWTDLWNKTVNRIRKHYGMPPLEGTNYGNL